MIQDVRTHTVETVSVRELAHRPGAYLRLALSGVAVRVINHKRPGAEVWLSAEPPTWWADDGTAGELERRRREDHRRLIEAASAARTVAARQNGHRP
jgi:hypothetical protein